jgi:hypothetical protein
VLRKSTQQGASVIAILGGVALLIIVATLLMRLGPHYIDWRTMQSIIGDLPTSQVHSMSKDEIRTTLKKRFRVNNMRDFDLREIMTIDRAKAGTVLKIDYERREFIVANVDVVLTFSEQYQYQ